MSQASFTFIDLFAGIGGFHLAMHQLGGKCVFASEIDRFARKTYIHNFQSISPELFEKDLFNEDIRNIVPEEIPDFDVLCAGFPCQPFSQAGYKRGFNDVHNSERGNLFFYLADILEAKQPKAYFLENVRGLINHNNGETFKTIREVIEQDLGYSFYYQIVKASDYGLPQLRPRTFIVGFRDESFLKGFIFPPKLSLKFNMSDVWNGACSREIGFTIRVGGRGSNISDRRNWDSYLVDGEVKKLSYIEARKMQGFPDDFQFPVSPTQAIKQLGNSVAIDAVKAVGKNIISYMSSLSSHPITMKNTKNKGEWSELLAFVKILSEQEILLSDKNLNPTDKYLKVTKVTGENIDFDFLLTSKNEIEIVDKSTGENNLVRIDKLIDNDTLNDLVNKIKSGKGSTFTLTEFKSIQDTLGLTIIKGGKSSQKSDIILDIQNDSDTIRKTNEGFGIKSFLGNSPTLFNASQQTNFIFEVINLPLNKVDKINSIAPLKGKYKKRIEAIEEDGGVFKYVAPEKENMLYNLKIVDSYMPEVIGNILLVFYKHRISKIHEIVNYIHDDTDLMDRLKYEDKGWLVSKIKQLLVDIMFGLFPGQKWDGQYKSNGVIIVNKEGKMLAFHDENIEELKSYLFNNIRLDTPKSKHKFGKLIIETNKKLYFKLNLQLRF